MRIEQTVLRFTVGEAIRCCDEINKRLFRHDISAGDVVERPDSLLKLAETDLSRKVLLRIAFGAGYVAALGNILGQDADSLLFALQRPERAARQAAQCRATALAAEHVRRVLGPPKVSSFR